VCCRGTPAKGKGSEEVELQGESGVALGNAESVWMLKQKAAMRAAPSAPPLPSLEQPGWP